MQVCGKLKDCGKHECGAVCHSGDCEPCELVPSRVSTCPCGKQEIDPNSRKSCLDPIPACDEVCGAILECGHSCRAKCHAGACPPCDIQLSVTCRCGRTDDLTIACGIYTATPDAARCDRPCKKKLSCARHTCQTICCPDRLAPPSPNTHICTRICGKKLSCGSHTCEDVCHRGNCRRCPNVSFDELHCAGLGNGLGRKLYCFSSFDKEILCNQICIVQIISLLLSFRCNEVPFLNKNTFPFSNLPNAIAVRLLFILRSNAGLPFQNVMSLVNAPTHVTTRYTTTATPTSNVRPVPFSSKKAATVAK